jgi:hypothetical protein
LATKSVRLYWDEKVIRSGKVLTFLFGERKDTVAAARLLITKMKANPSLAMTKREMRFFAKELEAGKGGTKYSYHNFYTKLLRKLLDLGFVERDVLIWDRQRKKTEAVYQLRLQAIPERTPQAGFFKQAWSIAKGWNDLIQG